MEEKRFTATKLRRFLKRIHCRAFISKRMKDLWLSRNAWMTHRMIVWFTNFSRWANGSLYIYQLFWKLRYELTQLLCRSLMNNNGGMKDCLIISAAPTIFLLQCEGKYDWNLFRSPSTFFAFPKYEEVFVLFTYLWKQQVREQTKSYFST